MIVRGTHAWSGVPGGTAGCVLTSNGPAATPTWQCALALNFLLPPMATNKVWGNVSGTSAAASEIDVNQFLNTIDYDIQRPPLSGSIPYKGTDNKWHTAPPPTPVGWVWTSQGPGQIPQWATPFMFGSPIPYSVLAAGADANPVFSTSFGLGGPLIGGSFSTQGTGINSVIASKQTDGASSTTGASGFEAISNSADIFLTANGTARTTSRYGVVIGGYNEITAPTGNGLLLGTLNSTPVIIGGNNTALMTLSAGNGIAVSAGVPVMIGGGGATNAALTVSGGNIVNLGNGTTEIYTEQLDGATSTTGASVVGAISASGPNIVVDGSLVANGFASTKTRYGLTLGGYVELSAFLGNGFIIGTAPATPIIFGTNNTERGRLLASGVWQFSTPMTGTSLALGGTLIGGSLSAQGTGTSAVIASKQTDGASSTTGLAGFETFSDVADILLLANGTARTTVRYGQTTGGWGEISLAAGVNGILFGTLTNTPIVFGANNTERGRINAATNEWVIGPGGATVPTLSSTLHITAADGALAVLGIDGFAATPFLAFRRADGTKAAPTAVQNGDALGGLFFEGRGATAYSSSRVEIDAFATENWTDAAQGTRVDFYTTPTGTIVPNLALRLAAGLGVGTTSDPGAGLIYLNSASFLMRNKTTWSNGAAAQTATLTNAPAAGNPTKWVPIDDNGTTRYIPTW